jgi:hypothetical protein
MERDAASGIERDLSYCPGALGFFTQLAKLNLITKHWIVMYSLAHYTTNVRLFGSVSFA